MAHPKDALKAGISGLVGFAQTTFGFMDERRPRKRWARSWNAFACDRTRRIDSNINDVETFPFLRGETFRMNVDFFRPAAYQLSPLVAALMPGQSAAPSPTTPTSPAPSPT